MLDALPLPPKYEALANELDHEPPQMRELLYYALVMCMVDAERAHVTGRRTEQGRDYVAIKTVQGEVFEIARPLMTEELEYQLRQQVWDLLEEE